MTLDHSFVIADVFTKTPFGGNQLAVLPDARGLSTEQMQNVAKEFGFSETTFVLPPQDPANTRQLRIFTPTEELPFAGHPTVGTGTVLAAGGHVDAGAPLIFEESVGPITVEVDGTYSRLITTAPFEAPPDRPSPKAVAAALSLPEENIAECWYGSVGVRLCYVRLDTADIVDSAVLDKAEWSAGVAGGWSPHIYVFAGTGEQVHARSFAPALGTDEDPATGSAAAGLVASLAVRSAADQRLRIDQGIRMGRPSRIDASAHTEQGQLTHVTVGGYTTVIAKGTLSISG